MINKLYTARRALVKPQAIQRERIRTTAPFGLVFRVILVAFSRRVLGCDAKLINLVDQDINSIFIVLPLSFSNEEIDFSMSD